MRISGPRQRPRNDQRPAPTRDIAPPSADLLLCYNDFMRPDLHWLTTGIHCHRIASDAGCQPTFGRPRPSPSCARATWRAGYPRLSAPTISLVELPPAVPAKVWSGQDLASAACNPLDGDPSPGRQSFMHLRYPSAAGRAAYRCPIHGWPRPAVTMTCKKGVPAPEIWPC
jgi:hypothetical protein